MMTIPREAKKRGEEVFLRMLREEFHERRTLAFEMYRDGSTWDQIVAATGWDLKLCEDVVLNGQVLIYSIRDASEAEAADPNAPTLANLWKWGVQASKSSRGSKSNAYETER